MPIVYLPGGSSRGSASYQPNFTFSLNYQHITKNAEKLNSGAAVWAAMRRAFTQAKNGRPAVDAGSAVRRRS